MANLVLLTEAAEHSIYSVEHMRYLIKQNLVGGKKQGGIWLIDLDDLLRYEEEMEEQGTQKHTSKKYKKGKSQFDV